ncbi:ferredoxin/thioredoxin reductase subunit A (variable subunit) 2 [Actinidia rufa]|uniref:Ferredoxin/thioredoxin reductase subunit A (Variable subunit) 2 n=1 Tax=Actinidia rufa TaxID=165716 RepID=A0A7J0F2U9_9ERIC|nr:ferredoxin/thioredoxin reductase subunit A (variable subunit) 2 [Actinidia rufa]
MMTSPAFFSTASLSHHHNALVFNVPIAAQTAPFQSRPRVVGKRSFARSVLAVNSATFVEDHSPSAAAEEEDEARIGARVRVTAPLTVYHVPRVAEIDLTGKEGVLKQNVTVWKGKRISANLPFKVEFVEEVEGRGRVKFFAHLKEDEFEYLD